MKYLERLTLALVSTFVAVGLLEVSLRILKSEVAPFVSRTSRPCVYVEDPALGYRYRPRATGWMQRNFEIDNFAEMNSIGFHDVEHDPSDLSSPRILAFGDSFTASLHVPVSKTWTQVLERQLNEPAPGLSRTVVNLGIDGTGTDIHLSLARQFVPIYRPDIVILAFYENDVGDMSRPKQYRECYKRAVLAYENHDQRDQLRRYVDANAPTRTARWLYDHFYVYRLATKSIGSPGLLLLSTNYVSPSQAGISVSKSASEPDHLDERLIGFKQLAAQYDFRLLIVPLPAKDSITASLDRLRQHASREVLQDLEVIDVSKPLEEYFAAHNMAFEDLFWEYDGHLNERGNDAFGTIVARVLRPRLRPYRFRSGANDHNSELVREALRTYFSVSGADLRSALPLTLGGGLGRRRPPSGGR